MDNNSMNLLGSDSLHFAPIVVIGVIGLAIIIDRTRILTRTYPLSNQKHFFDKVRDLVMAEKIAEAITLCDQYERKPIANVTREALLRAHQPESVIEDGLAIAVSEASEKINKRTPFLSTIANVATLLGLFGTIVGLIHSFEAVGSTNAQQRSAVLAAGISTAMNATMAGLAVAIPSMLAFSFLMNRANRLNVEVERAAVRMMDILKQRFYSADAEANLQSVKKAVS